MRRPSFSVNLRKLCLVLFTSLSCWSLIDSASANNFSENASILIPDDAQIVPALHAPHFETPGQKWNPCPPCRQDCHCDDQGSVITGLAVGLSIVIVLLLSGFVIAVWSQRSEITTLRRKMKEMAEEIQLQPMEPQSNERQSAIQYNPKFEISRNRLEIHEDTLISSGIFSCVFEGLLKPDSENDESNNTENIDADGVKVAVRTVRPNSRPNVTYFKTLVNELNLLCCLEKHEYIVSLLGAVTVNIRNRELIIAMELCPKGDLLNYLKNHKTNFKDLFKTKVNFAQRFSHRVSLDQRDKRSSRSSKVPLQGITHRNSVTYDNLPEILSTLDLVEWARQVSSAMAYISSYDIIHGDVSARNILLTEEKVAKISDFGLARKLDPNESEYQMADAIPLPWRWMALESLSDMVYSSKSDVWGFGVLLYEIFSLGEMPYPEKAWTHEFVEELKNGFRLSSPKFGSDEIHTLMMNCMKAEAPERIDFLHIKRKLEKITTKISPVVTYMSLSDCNYVRMDSTDSSLLNAES